MASSKTQQPEPHHYLQRLTELNATQHVTASEDIYNQFGVLLIAKGSRINPQAQRQLQQHRLEKNLNHQVRLQSTLSDKQLYQQTLVMLERSAELIQLHRRNAFDDLFRHLCLSQNLPLQIRQKLTVMSQQLPDLFQHSLFDGWAAALIASEMKLKPEACREAYVCGLIHDIGLLHLPPEVLTRSPLSERNWRALQSHVVIGQRCAEASGLPQSIGRGILEHHERLDQTGYPSRKAPQTLGLLGQLVASADLLHSLYTNELSHTKGSIHAARPHFRIHHGSFNEAIHSALMRILSRAAPDQTETTPSPQPTNLDRVRTINTQLLALLGPLAGLSRTPAATKHPKGQRVTTMMRSINSLLTNSGIADGQLNDWLMSELDPADPDNHRCLTEIDAMQYELLWLLKRLGWNLKDFLDTSQADTSALATELSRYQDQLSDAVGPAFKLYHATPKLEPEPDSDLIDLSLAPALGTG